MRATPRDSAGRAHGGDRGERARLDSDRRVARPTSFIPTDL